MENLWTNKYKNGKTWKKKKRSSSDTSTMYTRVYFYWKKDFLKDIAEHLGDSLSRAERLNLCGK